MQKIYGVEIGYSDADYLVVRISDEDGLVSSYCGTPLRIKNWIFEEHNIDLRGAV